MSRYKRHVFVCINERPKDHPKGSCHARGGEAVRDALKAEIGARGISGAVRTNNAGCLDACASGVVMVIYPDGIWYGGVTPADVPEIVSRTIVNGEVIERLLLKDERYRPAASQFPRLEG